MVDTIEVTVRQVFNALKKNGFEHLRGSWFMFKDEDGEQFEDMHDATKRTVVIGGCILGQGAINLGSDSDTLIVQLNQFKNKSARWMTLDRPVADSIIYWNDKIGVDGLWALPAYEDVVNMAHDILLPYFKEKITLKTYGWNITPKEDK